MVELTSRIEDFFYDEMETALSITTGKYVADLSDIPRKNLCDVVSNEFACLIEEFGYSVKSPVKTSVNGRKHFVAIVTETPNGRLESPIVVDGTLTQFNESYPEILIESVDSSMVEQIYDKESHLLLDSEK